MFQAALFHLFLFSIQPTMQLVGFLKINLYDSFITKYYSYTADNISKPFFDPQSECKGRFKIVHKKKIQWTEAVP